VSSNREDINAMIKAINGRKLHDLVREGSSKLASSPAGGSFSSAPVAATATAGAPVDPPKKEEKKEEEETNVDMGNLFGDDGY
jgi:large subunit ribosomal protein LP2